MDMQQYKDGLIDRLQVAGDAFYAVNNFYRCGDKDEAKRKELLTRILKVMPTLGEAIAVLDAVPPKAFIDLVKKQIVSASIISENQEQGRYGGQNVVYRIGDDLKIFFLHYLKGDLAIENEQSPLYFMGEYTFENLGRTCFSARDVCELVDSIDTRF